MNLVLGEGICSRWATDAQHHGEGCLIWSNPSISGRALFDTYLIVEDVILLGIGAVVGIVPLYLNHRPRMHCSQPDSENNPQSSFRLLLLCIAHLPSTVSVSDIVLGLDDAHSPYRELLREVGNRGCNSQVTWHEKMI